MKKTFTFTLLVILLFAGCTNIGSSKDDTIQPDIKLEINALKSKLIDALHSGNVERLEDLCSDQFVEKYPNLFKEIQEKIPPSIKNRSFISTSQFYTKNFAMGQNCIVQSGKGEHDFRISYVSLMEESIVITGYFETPVYQINLLAVYSKSGTNWEIYHLYLGNRFILNKDVYDYYIEAKKHLKNDHFLDAALNVLKIESLLSPAEDLWHYTKEKEIKQFCEKVKADYKKKFILPTVCKTISTKPTIYNVNVQEYDEKKLLPMIEYVTQLNINDSVAIEKESKLVHASIGKMFPGLDLNNESIIYRIWETNTPTNPEGTDSIFRTFIWDTKQ